MQPCIARTILLVDDDEGFTATLEITLRYRSGMRVHVQIDSLEACEDRLNFRPDAVVLKALMPGLDGEDLNRAIKSDGRLRATPVILVPGLYPRRRQRRG